MHDPHVRNDCTQHYDNGSDLNITAISPGDVMSDIQSHIHEARYGRDVYSCSLFSLEA